MLKKLFHHPMVLGVLFFSIQLLAIVWICPENNLFEAWLSLASHWDSEWYAAIAQYGYINIDGPIHCGLHNANVVFFPGYPYLARGLVLLLHMDARIALLIVAQGSACLFWCLLFYILRHLAWRQKIYAGVFIAVFPTSWFLFMAYSEAPFILACCLMLTWVTQKRWLLSGLTGIGMTATRLIGVPVLAAPFFAGFIVRFTQIREAIHARNFRWLRQDLIQPNAIIALGGLGCLGFLMYCGCHFGSWHLYFDMERIHWKGAADPWFLFKLPTWVPPPWGYHLDYAPVLPNGWAKLFVFDFYRIAAYSFSEMLVPIFAWLDLFFLFWMVKKSRPMDECSLTWLLASVLLFLFTCFSLFSRYYESMSRCLLPVWILLVISDALNPNYSFFFSVSQSRLQRIVVICFLIVGLGFWLQFLNRFFLGWWVA